MKCLLLVAALLASIAPQALPTAHADSARIQLAPGMTLHLGERDRHGRYWDGGRWRDYHWWRTNYRYNEGRWWRHEQWRRHQQMLRHHQWERERRWRQHGHHHRWPHTRQYSGNMNAIVATAGNPLRGGPARRRCIYPFRVVATSR